MITWELPELEVVSLEEAPREELPYKELYLDPATWDVAVPVRFVTGPDAVLQRVKVRFRFFLGEWFLDQKLGIPYYRDILIKNPDILLISSIFQRVLLTTPGVDRVATFKAQLLPAERKLLCDFVAFLSDGTRIIADAEPFILAGN